MVVIHRMFLAHQIITNKLWNATNLQIKINIKEGSLFIGSIQLGRIIYIIKIQTAGCSLN